MFSTVIAKVMFYNILCTIFLMLDAVRALQLGQSCSSNGQCNVTNSLCEGNICKCLMNMVDDNGDSIGGACRNEVDFAPRQIEILEIGEKDFKISWKDPVSRSSISHFVVTTSAVLFNQNIVQNITKAYTTIPNGCNQNQQGFVTAITGLTGATNYKILIESVVYGRKFGADIFQHTRPTKVGQINGTNIAPTIQVSWTVSPASRTESYVVEVRERNTLIKNTSTSGTSISVTGVRPGESYDIQIYGYISGLRSVPAFVTLPTLPIPPDPPKDIRYDRRSSTQLILHWLEPDNQYGTVDYYWIHAELENALTGSVIQTTFKATSWTINGIDTTKDYCFQIYSHNIGGFNSTFPAYICLIDSEPPVITNCPEQISAYADRGSTSTSVSWAAILGTDNSGKPVRITQTRGSPSGSKFEIGTHLVRYQAEDEVGNISPKCDFYIIVKGMKCSAPHLQDIYIVYECPTDYGYGFSCTLSCIGNYNLVGTTKITCEARNESSTSRDMFWDLNSAQEPFCNVSESPHFIHCPTTIRINLERGETDTVVNWDLPNVTDCSGRHVSIEQIQGQPPGHRFNVGTHLIQYKATSNKLQNTVLCSFMVIVEKESQIIRNTTTTHVEECSCTGLLAGVIVLGILFFAAIITIAAMCFRTIRKSTLPNPDRNYISIEDRTLAQINPDACGHMTTESRGFETPQSPDAFSYLEPINQNDISKETQRKSVCTDNVVTRRGSYLTPVIDESGASGDDGSQHYLSLIVDYQGLQQQSTVEHAYDRC